MDNPANVRRYCQRFGAIFQVSSGSRNFVLAITETQQELEFTVFRYGLFDHHLQQSFVNESIINSLDLSENSSWKMFSPKLGWIRRPHFPQRVVNRFQIGRSFEDPLFCQNHNRGQCAVKLHEWSGCCRMLNAISLSKMLSCSVTRRPI